MTPAEQARHDLLLALIANNERLFEVRLAAYDREFHEHLAQAKTERTLAIDAGEKAITKAEAATEKRFDAMNGFRQMLADQAASFMPRAEADARISSYDEKFTESIERNVERIGKLELAMQAVPSVAERDALHMASIGRDAALSDRMAAMELRLTSRLDLNQGKASGVSATVAVLVGAGGLLATIATVIIALIAIKP